MIKIKQNYQKKAIPGMREKFGYKNVMAIPKIKKVVVNIGFGRAMSAKTKEDQKRFSDYVVSNVAQIAGQRPVLTRAHKSISSFKLREGSVVGAKVTLRGKRMYDFLEKLVNIVLPRSRDFRGIALSKIDGSGNLNLGIKEHIIFPEISPEKSVNIIGLQVTIATDAKEKERGLELFRLLDFPLKKS
ncbi:MAG: 50S ribosomal protein L5 [Candidatus Pacebacteria bacterium]|nr:50S ribosomal protein L5 [Candidatus Paceibacterota bacterium]